MPYLGSGIKIDAVIFTKRKVHKKEHVYYKYGNLSGVVALNITEQILNYRDMSEEQRALALNSLSSIGFYPAYGKIKTMQRVMDKSIDGERP